MLGAVDIMREVRNCFPAERYEGEVSIRAGRLSPALFEGLDWVAIRGSRRADGIRQLSALGTLDGVEDETFCGVITALRPPADFLRLCGEISAWEAEHPMDGLKRERFAGYERELATPGGLPPDWRRVFAPQLSFYRRMHPQEELTW